MQHWAALGYHLIFGRKASNQVCNIWQHSAICLTSNCITNCLNLVRCRRHHFLNLQRNSPFATTDKALQLISAHDIFTVTTCQFPVYNIHAATT